MIDCKYGSLWCGWSSSDVNRLCGVGLAGGVGGVCCSIDILDLSWVTVLKLDFDITCSVGMIRLR